jgi:hypothetical protein
MSTIIICAIVVVLVGLFCEIRLLMAEKQKLRLQAIIKDREERIEGLGAMAMEMLEDLKATYHVLADKAPEEDIDLLIQEKKFELLTEEE